MKAEQQSVRHMTGARFLTKGALYKTLLVRYMPSKAGWFDWSLRRGPLALVPEWNMTLSRSRLLFVHSSFPPSVGASSAFRSFGKSGKEISHHKITLYSKAKLCTFCAIFIHNCHFAGTPISTLCWKYMNIFAWLQGENRFSCQNSLHVCRAKVSWVYVPPLRR